LGAHPHCAVYGADIDVDAIRAWWSWRSLVAVRWLANHGFVTGSCMSLVVFLGYRVSALRTGKIDTWLSEQPTTMIVSP
jgi:hypothetical protein